MERFARKGIQEAERYKYLELECGTCKETIYVLIEELGKKALPNIRKFCPYCKKEALAAKDN